MAWTIPTYSGHRMTGSAPNGYRTAVFELCRAVNERQGALYGNGAKTSFIKADGSTGTDIASDDFIGQFVTGTDSDWAANLNAVQTAIVTRLNVGDFSVASGSHVALTKAAVEAAIGTDLDTPIAKPNDTRFLQAQVDALNMMIYGRQRRLLALGGGTPNHNVSSRSTAGFGQPTADDAWDNMLLQSFSGFSQGTVIGYSVAGSGSNYSASENRWCTGLEAPLLGLGASGTLQAVWWEVTPTNLYDTSLSIDVKVGVSTYATGTISGDGGVQYLAGDTGDGDIANDVTGVLWEKTSSAPGSNPMDGPNDTGTVTFRAAMIQCFDIAGELTDQA